MKKFLVNKKIIVSAIAALVIIAGAMAYWFIGTPQYSMMKLKNAIEVHDADTAMSYIDIDAIFDGLWAKMQGDAIAELTKSKDEDGFAAFGATLGMSFLEGMKPGIKEMMRNTIKDAIANADPKESEKQKLREQLSKKFEFERKGDSASIKTSDGVKFILKQGDNRAWRIVGIEGMDDLVAEPKNATYPGTENK